MQKQMVGNTVVSTSLMTAFSYALSNLSKENFREPQLLSHILHRRIAQHKSMANFAGWSLHYLMGAGWIHTYQWMIKQKLIIPSFRAGAITGAVSGLIAVAVWKSMSEMHPLSLRTNTGHFYLQLIPSHMVFAISAMIMLRRYISK